MSDIPTNQSQLIVEEEDNNTRIDLFLVQRFPEFSRSFIQNQILSGVVKINNTPVLKAKILVETGNIVEVTWPEKKAEKEFLPQKISFDILYEDEDILIINKPAGLVVHPGEGNFDGTVVNGLLYQYPELFQDVAWPDPTRAGIVHRLDKDTSGILLIAKTIKIANKLQKMFKNHETSKFYYAIVHGHLPYTQGRIENYLARHPTQRQKRAVVPKDTPNAKLAISSYRVMSEAKLASLARINIETGRTHQIRVHMAYSHCPVVGDPLYGGVRAQIPDCPKQQALHAWKLTFIHPTTEEEITIISPLPEDFKQLAKRLDLTIPPEAEA